MFELVREDRRSMLCLFLVLFSFCIAVNCPFMTAA